MTNAIRIHDTGGPEVLRLEDIQVGDPGPKQVRLRQTASGLNFVDIQLRRGILPTRLPTVLGNEGAGVVEAVGEGVTSVKAGDRVAYGMSTGSYATQRLIREDLTLDPSAGTRWAEGTLTGYRTLPAELG